jgi:hypothetical protein
MIRIDPRTPIANATQASQARRTGAAFELPKKEQAAPARASSVHASAPLDTLLAVQAQEDPAERRKRQARRGHDLLDGLDRLKAALLSGRVQIAELERLKGMLSARREITDDPRLDEVLAHIELRAAVELAKLGR